MLVQTISQAICDKKGFNLLVLDVREVASLTDYFVFAEGNVERHVQAIGKGIIEVTQEKGYPFLHTEGLQEGDWVVLDYAEVIVHLFLPSMRDKFRVEEVWKKGKIVNVELE